MTNREILEENIVDIIDENLGNNKFMDNVKKRIMDKGISAGEFAEIWNKNIELSDITIVKIFILSQILFSITGNNKINPTKYFTPTEIQDGSSIVINNKEETISFPYTFHNAIKGKEDQFLFFLSASELKKLYDSQLIIYNYETQRDPKMIYDKKEDEIIKSINIVPASVKEIKKCLEENLFITNTITLNLLADGTDRFVYDGKGNLTVESGQLNVLDGFHRIMGMVTALTENPDLDYITEVRLTNFSIAKAKRFIVQEDKRNKINKRYISTNLDTSKIGSKVVNRLNESESDMQGKITYDLKILKAGKAYTIGSVLADSIEEVYELKNNFDVQKVSEWLGEFFDYLIGLKYEDFSNILKSREENVVTYPHTFILYITLSKILYDTRNGTDWQKKLESMLQIFEFSLNNEDWEYLGIEKDQKMTTSIRKSKYRKINAYCESKVRQIK
jgi:hypothetical protein